MFIVLGISIYFSGAIGIGIGWLGRTKFTFPIAIMPANVILNLGKYKIPNEMITIPKCDSFRHNTTEHRGRRNCDGGR